MSAAEVPKMPKMSVNIATLCDSATTDDDGKLNVNGVFDTVFATQFPAVHPHCSLAVRLTVTQEEFKKHAVKIRFLDSKGDIFFRDLETPWDIGPKHSDATIISENLIVELASLEFPRQGTYFIQLWLDGRPLTTLHLHAKPPTTRWTIYCSP